jgi:hypothetical protein
MSRYQYYSVRDFARRKHGFPLKRTYKDDDEIRQMMDRLRRLDYRDRIAFGETYEVRALTLPLLYGRESVLLLNHHEDYEDFNILSDMFMEETRMKALLIGRQHSPYEYFRRFPHKVAKHALHSSNVISPKSLSDAIYAMAQIKECTSFRPGIMVMMIQMLFGRDHGRIKVLDPSSGWGDRLIASIAADVDYTGFDPNTALVPGYKAIKKFFSSDATTVNAPFEDAKLDEYDLVFTSPPYFDWEVYSDEATQSIKKFPKVEAWTKEFLLPYVEKAWDALKPGGFMAINIGQRNGQHYVEDMVKHVTSLGGEYLGVVAHSIRGRFSKAQPIFIWRKASPLPYGIDDTPLSLHEMSPKDMAIFGKDTRAAKGLGEPCVMLSVYDGDDLVAFVGYAPFAGTKRSVLRMRIIKSKSINPMAVAVAKLFLKRFNYALIMGVSAQTSAGRIMEMIADAIGAKKRPFGRLNAYDLLL